MASSGLRGENEYSYCTTNSILWGVFETKFCFKSYGLGVKVEHTDRRTDSFRFYIYRLHYFASKRINLHQKASVCTKNIILHFKALFHLVKVF